MKNYKILLISFVLLIFMIGAVSASEVNSDDSVMASTDESAVGGSLPGPGIIPIIPDIPINPDFPIGPGGDDDPVEGEVKDIYVADNGDDSNDGSDESPYSTIGRAVQDVSEADEATIYIGEGTYSSDNDLNFEIELNHQSNGNANLKFIGAGADKTFIDGLSAFRFAHFGQGTNVTVKDITFINCKGGMGGTLYSEGILNVENCIFKDSYATEGVGGAIASGWDWSMGLEDMSSLTVKNSQFINCAVNSLEGWMDAHGGGAIFVGQMKSYIENNTFINTAVSEEMGSGAAVLLWVSNGAKVINNKFINITGFTEDAGLNLAGWEGFEVDVINNTFINCTNPSDMFSIVYFFTTKVNLKNNNFINSTNSVGNYYAMTSWIDKLYFQTDVNQINVSNNEIRSGFSLPINITDDNGNTVKSNGDFKVQLSNENNTYLTNTQLNNGILKFGFSEIPDDGIYNLTVLYDNYNNWNGFNSNSDVLATVNVKVFNDPVEVYVSPKGSNANLGTKDSPFATIQHALDVGFEKSFTVIVHLLKGTYSGDDNIQMTISSIGSIQVLGEAYNETIIDGSSSNWFYSFGSNVVVENLSFINCKSTNRNLISGGILKDCIIDNCSVASTSRYVISGSVLDGVTYTNNYGVVSPNGNLSNSYFANNYADFIRDSMGSPRYGGVIIFYGVIENCTFINNTSPRGGVIWSNDGVISRNNYYADNKAFVDPNSGYPSWYGYGGVICTSKGTFINDTFENNNARTGGVIGYDLGYSPMTLNYNFTGCKFINNSAEEGGVSALTVGTFSNCEFINNSADYGGVFSLKDYNQNSNMLELNDVVFDGNTAKISGNDIYLSKKYSGNTFFPIDLTINFNDLNVSLFTGEVSANVVGPCDAQIGGSTIYFVLDGKNIGSSELINGVATLSYAGFDEGNYTLSGSMSNQAENTIINNGTVIVKLEGILDNVTYYVSNDGSDENGNGSQENPFKSISYAVAQASKNCHDITLNIAEGTYTGDLNTALSLSSVNNLKIIGAGVGKTIIDGENSTYFAIITEGENRVVISDLTIQNMLPENVEKLISQNNPKFDDVCPITVYETATLYLDNVNINNCHGGNAIILNKGDLVINNSVLNNNGLAADIISGDVTIDNTLFDENFFTKSLINGIASINNSEIKNAFVLSDSNNQNNYCLINGQKTIIENTKISNDGDNSSLKEIGYNAESDKFDPAFSFYSKDVLANNISMVCDYNSESVQDYWYAGSKYKLLAPFANILNKRNVTVYNSTFRNFNCLWGTYLVEQKISFDGCVFDNISFIAHVDFTDESEYNITNSVFIGVSPVIDKYSAYMSIQKSIFNCTFENNYWGSNDKPVVTFINSNNGEPTYEPTTWITLYSEDEMTVIKNVTDGENSTEYTGIAPIREGYADDKGMLGHAVVFGPVGYLFTTDDEDNVIFNPEDAIYPFEDVDPMNYRDNAVMNINKINGSGAVFGTIGDVMGNPIANATIVYTLNGVEANTTTDENGSFVVLGGNGDLNITFVGNDMYFPIENVLTLENIAPVKTETKFDLAVDGNLLITGILSDINGNKLANVPFTYVVNGSEVNATTDANGAFTIEGVSNDTVVMTFAGDDSYLVASTSLKLENIAPTRIATVIESDYTFTRQANDYSAGERGDFFYATLKDINGNPIANVTCYVAVNGPIYNVTTDENGKFGVQVNLAAANTYTYALSFLGNEKYEASLNCSKLVLTAKKTTITAKAIAFKAKAKTKTISVTLSTVKNPYDGKTYLKAGKKLTMKLNGKTYTAKINAKGVAKFTIKLTKKGKYTAKITFAGDKTYKASSKSIKVTIK